MAFLSFAFSLSTLLPQSLIFLACVGAVGLGLSLLVLAVYLVCLCCCRRDIDEDTKRPDTCCVTWAAVITGLIIWWVWKVKRSNNAITLPCCTTKLTDTHHTSINELKAVFICFFLLFFWVDDATGWGRTLQLVLDSLEQSMGLSKAIMLKFKYEYLLFIPRKVLIRGQIY